MCVYGWIFVCVYKIKIVEIIDQEWFHRFRFATNGQINVFRLPFLSSLNATLKQLPSKLAIHTIYNHLAFTNTNFQLIWTIFFSLFSCFASADNNNKKIIHKITWTHSRHRYINISGHYKTTEVHHQKKYINQVESCLHFFLLHSLASKL